MDCKYCNGSNYRKNGYSNGFQRYNCKDCGRNWTMDQGKSYSKDMRFKALKRYLEATFFISA